MAALLQYDVTVDSRVVLLAPVLQSCSPAELLQLHLSTLEQVLLLGVSRQEQQGQVVYRLVLSERLDPEHRCCKHKVHLHHVAAPRPITELHVTMLMCEARYSR